jgi:hypothetical protein
MTLNEMLTEIIEEFVRLHSGNIEGAKYSINQSVNVPRLHCGGRILAINDTGDGIEYVVEGVPFLLWESEIEED